MFIYCYFAENPFVNPTSTPYVIFFPFFLLCCGITQACAVQVGLLSGRDGIPQGKSRSSRIPGRLHRMPGHDPSGPMRSLPYTHPRDIKPLKGHRVWEGPPCCALTVDSYLHRTWYSNRKISATYTRTRSIFYFYEVWDVFFTTNYFHTTLLSVVKKK